MVEITDDPIESLAYVKIMGDRFSHSIHHNEIVTLDHRITLIIDYSIDDDVVGIEVLY